MKTKKMMPAFALFSVLSLAASSFEVHKPNESTTMQKKFATYLCNHQSVTSDLDAGGTEVLAYLNFSLDAANNNVGTVATINYVDIESSNCLTYTINSVSGTFIRAYFPLPGNFWKAQDVTVHYTNTNGQNGTLHLVNYAFHDGGYAC
jgi:hypothetical protein